MPEIKVVFFVKDNKTVPLIDWMDLLKPKVQDKCIVKIERLKEKGYELSRPEAALLRDGIYELRIKHKHVQYRILYFFHEGTAILSHGIQKEDIVPPKEINHAIQNKDKYIENPQLHTYEEEEVKNEEGKT
jgi:phage-related protein